MHAMIRAPRHFEDHAAAPTVHGSRVWQRLETLAESDPDRPAIEESARDGSCRRWTFAQLRQRSLARAAVLSERLEPGAIVVLHGTDGARHVAWMLAAMRAGLWVLPTPMQTTREELVDLQHRCKAAAIIAPSRDLDKCDWIDSELPADAEPATNRDASCGGIVLVTSGTTGDRKLVIRDADALDADAANVVVAAGLRADDRLLLTLSLSHSYGIDLVVGGLLAGATLELVPLFDLAAVTRRLSGGVTVFPGVPFLFEGLTPRWEGLGALRLTFSAGSRMPEPTRQAFEAATRLPIGDLYGSSELGTVIFRDPSNADHEPGLLGSPLPGVSARILAPQDPSRTLGVGQEGELAIRAPSMLRGYLDGPAPLVDGHFLTGDLARLDARGRVFLTGRTRFLIESGGQKFNPVEVERVIESHPQVLECLVETMPVSETISRVRALIVPKQPDHPPTDAELRGFLRGKIGSAKIPRRFQVVSGLRRSASGKVLRTVPGEPRS